jgi:hypothetical protein
MNQEFSSRKHRVNAIAKHPPKQGERPPLALGGSRESPPFAFSLITCFLSLISPLPLPLCRGIIGRAVEETRMLGVPMADELNVAPATATRAFRMGLSILHLCMNYGCLSKVLESVVWRPQNHRDRLVSLESLSFWLAEHSAVAIGRQA